MTPVPPFFTCGECGGQIARWPMLNLLKQEILDWRHFQAPRGVAPHRAVLGTPVPIAELKVDMPAEVEEPGPVVVPPPEVPARPALAGDLPVGAARLDKLAQEFGWTVEAWFMRGTRMDARWRPSRVVSSVVLRLWRDGHRLIATWETDNKDAWSFGEGYSITRQVEPVGSPELRRLIGVPRSICESCHEPPALHVSTNTGPVCFNEFRTAQAV